MRPTFIIAAASVAALLTLTGYAQAQNNRSFVSGHGSDSNPCSLAAPCRTFAQALTQTNAGGEIAVLDTAGYGPVTIAKSISIVNEEGVEAGIAVATPTDAIDINIGASDVVNLRGLTLTGGGIGIVGIAFNDLGALNIQNCVIRGFTIDGLSLRPNGDSAFNISDTIVSNAFEAVLIQPTGSFSNVTAAFNRVQVTGAGDAGFLIDGAASTGTLNVTIANSAATNNNNGIISESVSGAANTQVVVTNTVVSNNGLALLVDGLQSVIFVGKNTIAGNNQAFSVINSAGLFSFGDNYIKGNGTDNGAITLVSTK